ncbi:MAG: hypothetical protein ACOYKD_07370 [Anaerolineaceae bacterium]
MPKRLPDYSEPISITFTDDGNVDFNALYEVVEEKVTSIYKDAYFRSFRLQVSFDSEFRMEKEVVVFRYYQKRIKLFGFVTERKLITGAVDLENGLISYSVYNENRYIIEDPIILEDKNTVYEVLNVISPILQNNQKDMKSEVSILLVPGEWLVSQTVFAEESQRSFHVYELDIDTLTIRESNK